MKRIAHTVAQPSGDNRIEREIFPCKGLSHVPAALASGENGKERQSNENKRADSHNKKVNLRWVHQRLGSAAKVNWQA